MHPSASLPAPTVGHAGSGKERRQGGLVTPAPSHSLAGSVQVGIQYYDQMLRQIPRAEIAAAEAIVRQAVFELCEGWGAADVERTFAFATGSYCRGKPTSSELAEGLQGVRGQGAAVPLGMSLGG